MINTNCRIDNCQQRLLAADLRDVIQHIGWLKQYLGNMTEDNWRDMKLRAERQLEELSTALRQD